ncbi:MAG: serine/threonine-protein kinase [Pyrinomonadaceae bacterium]
MEPERWEKITELFHRAKELEKGERTSFLKRSCAGDETLFEEVARFVLAHHSAGDFIEQPAFREAIEALAEESEKPVTGRRFGVYQLIEEIGRGGMGAVYLAERADFEKRVAVKIIKGGMDTEAVISRFRNERRILASLEHENIARLLDGGTTDDDRPYFVMEYIEGLPITKYAAEHSLSVKERLELFRRVCSAVAYAHQRLVIHRDIKSSNILVTGDGTPKLLDFGIAKLTAPDRFSVEDPVTEPGLQLMTPEYASPEQISGEPVTTATDIYSLGVVLFELLTGKRPFDKQFRESGKILQAVIQTDPPKPSDVASEAETSAAPAENTSPTTENDDLHATEMLSAEETERLIRKTNPSGAVPNPRSLRGDIDNIILKALQKEPENRYLTVEQFSEDIRRHLNGLPVIARPLSLKYRLTKFVRRNRLAVGLGALIFLTLIGGIIATTWQSIRADRQRSLAEKRFAEVRKLANTVLFDYHDAIKNLPGSTPVRARIVRDALEYLDGLAGEAGDDISLQRELAAAYEKVGDVQGGTAVANLGDTEGAIASYRKSLKIREDILRVEPNGFEARRDVAGSYVKLASLLSEKDELDAALENNRRGLEIFLALSREGPGNPEILYQLGRTYGEIGSIIHDRGDLRGALDNFQRELNSYQSLPENERASEKARRGIALSYEHMGIIGISSSDYETALENNRRALELRQKLSEDFPLNADYRRMVAVSYYNQGEILGNLKRYAEALESYRRDVEIVRDLSAKDPQNEQFRGDLAYGYLRLGDMEVNLGRAEKGLAQFRASRDLRAEDVRTDPSNLWKKSSLIEAETKICRTLAETGQIESMERTCASTLTLVRETPVEPTNGMYRNFFAETYANLGEAYLAVSKIRKDRFKTACEMFDRAMEIQRDIKARGLFEDSQTNPIEELMPRIKACRGESGT